LRAKLWGTRGSIAVAGPDTIRYGGDTSAVELRCVGDRLFILDGGSGIRALGVAPDTRRIDILLSHLHMDHVQGLPFFAPLLDPEFEVHIWGPASTTRTLRQRIARYLSPPLFPVRVRDLANVRFHDVTPGEFEIDGIQIVADLISHPGATLGYRLTEGSSSLAYMSDHEPSMGRAEIPTKPEWTSGFGLAEGADVLIHDAQYSDEEYASRVGWGHSSTSHLAAFTAMAKPGRLVTFHHDPAHTDDDLDVLPEALASKMTSDSELVPGTPGLVIDV
jgi:phosphoribosyl 1,2-cyclic phosphodiesterase